MTDGSGAKLAPESAGFRPRRMSIASQPHGSYDENNDDDSFLDDEYRRTMLREQTAGLSDRALREGMEHRESGDESMSDNLDSASTPRSRLTHILGARTSKSPLLNSGEVQVFSEGAIEEDDEGCTDEHSSLLTSETNSNINSSFYDTFGEGGNNNNNNNSFHAPRFRGRGMSASEDLERQELRDLERMDWMSRMIFKTREWLLDSKHMTKDQLVTSCIKQPISYIPAVILGTLLNILDGVSYGMILFPLGEPIFANMGMAGLSMFYVSCVVAQLVYSLGGSTFKGGAGGEMIEVVPFFHAMATTIMHDVGTDRPQEVISTTIVSFALSSIITGGVFFFLGYAKLGSLIGFFPRHILVGCVGGVGWFLVVTGIEVSSRLGTLEYSFTMLAQLFAPDVLLKWGSPLLLALILLVIQKFTHNSLVLPTYFIFITIVFHTLAWAVPQWSLDFGRQTGWIFEPPEFSEPWYSFYSFYDFTKVQYLSVLKTVPAMFALTFFGILHVPINVPALAASTGEDNVDVDRELIAHGVSNAVSGMLGSVQNYLVYTNSLLFIKGGADSRVAGVMLAGATFCVMLAGPVIIGYIPVMVVGALIFLLGIELMQEALVDTYGRVSQFEYFTIVVIVVTMGAWDFVYGILAGIVLACVSFVIQASRTNAVRATYTGKVARSTVRRHAVQRKFLEQVGDQIYVLKLTGQVFFGTIVHIESTVRDLLDELYFSKQPIRYLVLDISAVTEIDFSAAEAFARMNRLLRKKDVFMLLCGVQEDFKVMKGLKAIKLWDNNEFVRLFGNLNSALEWCENEFLSHYYLHRNQYNFEGPSAHEIPKSHRATGSIDDYSASPRGANLHQAAESTVQKDIQVVSKWQHFKQPLPLMMQIFEGISLRNEDFWSQVAPYFRREELKAGTVLYQSDNDAKGFYLVQSGILRADYDLEQGQLYESILAGTTCGELPFFSETQRTATVTAEVDSVVWKLDKENWEKIKSQKDINSMDIANELLTIALKLTVERFESVTAYVLISTS